VGVAVEVDGALAVIEAKRLERRKAWPGRGQAWKCVDQCGHTTAQVLARFDKLDRTETAKPRAPARAQGPPDNDPHRALKPRVVATKAEKQHFGACSEAVVTDRDQTRR